MTVGGDISDGAKTIYDSASGRLDYSVLPYHKGDLTSDWASNSYTSGYYNAVAAGDVKEGVSFGRSEAGTLTPSGTATASTVFSGYTFFSGDSWVTKTGSFPKTLPACLTAWGSTGSIWAWDNKYASNVHCNIGYRMFSL